MYPVVKTTLVISVLLLVSACGSTKKLTLQDAGHQYCTTEKVMVEQDGKIEAIQVTKCNDDEVKKLLPPKMGLGKNCREFWYDTVLDGAYKKRRGFACQFKGDTYETTKWYIVQSPY